MNTKVVCIVFLCAVLVGQLRAVTTTCASEFSKVHDQSEDAMTDCTHIGGGAVNTLANCKNNACSHGGNAFNWKNGVCYYKKCEAGKLILNKGTAHGGWDIYAIDTPVTPSCEFSKVHDQSEDAMTDCTHIGGGVVNTLENCKHNTCSHGGNAFNWKNGICYYKKCEAGDLKLATSHDGWNVYALIEGETAVGCLLTTVEISCDGSKQIKIISATFGRSDSYTCLGDGLSEMENTGCITDVKETLGRYCNGPISCQFTVYTELFGKECENSAPYLTYTFTCVDV